MGNALLKPRNNTSRLTPSDRQKLRTIVADLGWQRSAKAIGVSVPTLQTLESDGRCSADAVARCVAGLGAFELSKAGSE